MVGIVQKSQCSELFNTNLDIKLFLKESKRRLTEFEMFIKDQKIKIHYNHKELKRNLERSSLMLNTCLERVLVHYLRVVAAYRKLKMQIFAFNQSVPLFKATDFHIQLKDQNRQKELETIYYNSEGELGQYLEFIRDQEGKFHIRNEPLHVSIKLKLNDFRYGRPIFYKEGGNIYERFDSLRHPWLLKDQTKYGFILDKNTEYFPMTHDQIRMMKFPVEKSPVSKKLGEIDNLISYDHGCIELHPREMDGKPI